MGDTDWKALALELGQKNDSLQAQIDALISAGTRMSNACFNMAQWVDLPEGQPEILKAMQIKWDEAVRKTPAQSLSEIKALAIDEFMDDVLAVVKHSGSESIKWFRLREEKESFLARLRQQGNG